MTVLIAVGCPHCYSTEVVKYSQSSNGKQRLRCRNSECPRLTFSLDLAYRGLKSEVKQQIIEMTLNSSGVRDIARVLQISPTTVIKELKKSNSTGSSQSSFVESTPTRPSRSHHCPGRWGGRIGGGGSGVRRDVELRPQ